MTVKRLGTNGSYDGYLEDDMRWAEASLDVFEYMRGEFDLEIRQELIPCLSG